MPPLSVRSIGVAATIASVALGGSTDGRAPGPLAGPDTASAAQPTGSGVEWRELSPADSPGVTRSAAMAYDAGDDRMILFGGQSDVVDLDETWAWDGTTWAQLHPTTSPPARTGHAMAYDPVRQEVVVFGGFDKYLRELGDTWVFQDGEWSERHPATAPRPLYGASMAFDPNLQQVILVGGHRKNFLDATWTWDGVTWTKLHPRRSAPARIPHGLAYDPARNALVMFGGWDATPFADGTWRWNGFNWKELSLRRSPSPRTDHVLATFGDGVLLHGGQRKEYRDAHGTWVLHRHTWERLRPHPHPDPRKLAVMDWDPVRQQAVLFGGYNDYWLNDTWTANPVIEPAASR